MEGSRNEEEKISIRCPRCAQRFRVTPEFEGKMVECGSCDERFRVTEEVIVRARKFYPGEHKDTANLQRFNRVPTRTAAPIVSSEPFVAAPPRELVTFSPLRLMLGIGAVAGVLIVAAILGFGGAPGQVLDGAPMDKRLVLAGFSGFLACLLLVAANPRARIKGLIGGLLCLAALMSIPFFVKTGLPTVAASDAAALPQAEGSQDGGEKPTEAPADDVSDLVAQVRAEMRSGPLEEAIELYGETGKIDGRTVVGVWLRDVRDFNKDLIMRYLVRVTGADDRSWSYPRPPSDCLILLHGVTPELSEIAGLCERFGTPGRIIEDLHAVEVKVDNQRFLQGPEEKLTDTSDPSFYELNRRELDSIDVNRAAAAAKRLAAVEPKLFRSDITQRLQELAKSPDPTHREAAVRALQVWSEEGDGSLVLVRDLMEEMLQDKRPIPRAMVQFLSRSKDAESAALVQRLWQDDPGEWENLFGDFGPVIEADLVAAYPELTLKWRLSAIRLLGRTGGQKSLELLSRERAAADGEMASLIEQAMKAIGERN
ncbi:MAG: hypothetical protein MUF31_08105 [Akkermansiaceae bacterium]|nr:hypothetical protein [Akkermansiaceae bacterium]